MSMNISPAGMEHLLAEAAVIDNAASMETAKSDVEASKEKREKLREKQRSLEKSARGLQAKAEDLQHEAATKKTIRRTRRKRAAEAQSDVDKKNAQVSDVEADAKAERKKMEEAIDQLKKLQKMSSTTVDDFNSNLRNRQV
jgi:Skp family chaperone for outer membrane proteins